VEPAAIKVKAAGSGVISFRLPRDESDRLEDAAAATGETISQFVRGAIAMRLEGGRETPPSVNRVEAGALRLTIRSAYAGSSTRIGDSYFVAGSPDFAPLTVQGTLRYDSTDGPRQSLGGADGP
jgi:hypothetical protein